MEKAIKEPPTVWSKGRETAGKATGGERVCQMSGCTGTGIVVRWPSGKITIPCTKGMKKTGENEWEIL